MLYIDECKHWIFNAPEKKSKIKFKNGKKVARTRARTSDPRNPVVKNALA
jgi:hypothetical protein